MVLPSGTPTSIYNGPQLLTNIPITFVLITSCIQLVLVSACLYLNINLSSKELYRNLIVGALQNKQQYCWQTPLVTQCSLSYFAISTLMATF